ncbi:MAG: response regulator transcription factor [Chloroflexota bacterium]
MARLLVIADTGEGINGLCPGLEQAGFTCLVASGADDPVSLVVAQSPDLVLVATDVHPARVHRLSGEIKRARQLPIIAIATRHSLDRLAIEPGIDDFIVKPYDIGELTARIKRRLPADQPPASGEAIRCGELVIDLVGYEVRVAGREVALTYREYELVRFLAGHPGRVFSRDTLLSRVWGDDYYGGERTVDVHIRRLRNKIEDSGLTFIETVRSIGYRWRK